MSCIPEAIIPRSHEQVGCLEGQTVAGSAIWRYRSAGEGFLKAQKHAEIPGLIGGQVGRLVTDVVLQRTAGTGGKLAGATKLVVAVP